MAALGKPVKNANLYEGRASIDGGVTWLPSVFAGDSRHVIRWPDGGQELHHPDSRAGGLDWTERLERSGLAHVDVSNVNDQGMKRAGRRLRPFF